MYSKFTSRYGRK